MILMTVGSFELCVNEPDKSAMFSTPGIFTPFSVVQRFWHLEDKLENSPTAGLGCFTLIIQGFALILLVPISLVIDHEGSIDAVNDVLKDIDPAVLEKQVGFGMGKGHAVWCPLGYFPNIVGATPPKNTGKDTNDKGGALQYVAFPVLDTFAYYKAHKAVQVEVTERLQKICCAALRCATSR